MTMTTLHNQTLQIRIAGPIFGDGRLAPLLRVPLEFRLTGAHEVRLDNVVVRVSCNRERIGTGNIVGPTIWQGENVRMTVVEIPTTGRLLDWVTKSLAAGGEVPLMVLFHGSIRHRSNSEDPWQDDEIVDTNIPHQISISRTAWFDHVLSPISDADYVYLEVAIPRKDQGGSWRQSLKHLADAEAAYAFGDDVATFQRLRGILDALPGAKQHILDSVPDARKRDTLNALTQAFGAFLHTGRHVGDAGTPLAGEFPIDHVDAGFAIAQAKVLLSYFSRIVNRQTT